ncbi:MAG: hypothetical protein ACOYM3_12145 [Terrimicrobiaceae bacterium]
MAYDALNRETLTTYDAAKRVVKVEEPSVPISGEEHARPACGLPRPAATGFYFI